MDGKQAELEARGINPTIPYTVDENGAFTEQAPGFTGKRVINDKGEKGDANEAVIKALIEAGMLIARGRLKHQYPHSWRSKKPIIFRNTPQWFIAMDKGIDKPGDTLRARAMQAISDTHWVPPQGENRINGMVDSKPDWVISRQRAWGVPIAVFIKEKPDGSVDILDDVEVNMRIVEAFDAEGADAWYKPGARERFLGALADDGWQKVDDILDVWFDSGSTHAFVLEDPVHFPSLAGIKRKRDGGADTVMYLEGSDQHRGWFQSSLLESCGTRGRAPFDVVVTHGFTLAEDGRKMSKSLGNTIAPQDVIKQSGADILRMWVASADYWDDQRIGPEILKTTTDTYRKLRNTIRWMLGNLAHFHEDERVKHEAMPELERLMLHRLGRARRPHPPGLRRIRLQAHLRRARLVYDLRSVGVLFRHPQGRALLRSDLVDDAQGLPDRARSPVPLHGDLARADALLHRRGILALALWRQSRARCISNCSPRCRRPGATTNSPRNGARCAPCAASSPARWRSSARRSASAPRSKRIRLCTSRMRTCSRPSPMSISPRSASPRRRRWWKARGRLTPSGCPTYRALPWCRISPKDANARARGKSSPPSAPIRSTRMFRRATPRRCANGKPCARRRSSRRATMSASSYLSGPFTRSRPHRRGHCLRPRPGQQAIPPAGLRLADRSPVHVTPFIDFVLARNTGISYGLFQTQGALGQWVMLGFKVVAVVLLWVWLARAHTRLTALSLGLIIGGAVGNAIDRLAYGWVADFVFFHISGSKLAVRLVCL